jgi:hypothetical protein
MRNSIFPVATLGALLIAVFGAATTGRGPQRGVAGPGTPERLHTQKRESQSTPPTCTKGEPCDDHVVSAKRFAKQEADETLKETICDFLAEYGVTDAELAETQKNGAPRNNTYCTTTAADKMEGAGPGTEPEVDPAIRPRVIVAVLPDPVHTQLALRFDESADELQNSMQDLGWTYDRAWLPWDNKEHEDAEDFDQRMENKGAQESYERSPGAILFRADPDKGTKQQLIVLVVGDTPTEGVHAEAFRNAIKIWKQLTGWDNYTQGRSEGRGILNASA